jgi:Zn-dependent protease
MPPELALLRIPAILLALTIHEYAHGWVASRCGDDTAREAGRLTLNPLAHLDVFGTLMMFFGPFGWAKPVPVNPYRLRQPRRDSILVSAAGPASNVLCAAVVGLLYRVIVLFDVTSLMHPYILLFLQLAFLLNIGLSFFNLIPVPPLDGSRILMGLLPPSNVGRYLDYMRYAPRVFLVLIIAEWMFHVPLFSAIIYPVFKPYLAFWQFVLLGRKVLVL